MIRFFSSVGFEVHGKLYSPKALCIQIGDRYSIYFRIVVVLGQRAWFFYVFFSWFFRSAKIHNEIRTRPGRKSGLRPGTSIILWLLNIHLKFLEGKPREITQRYGGCKIKLIRSARSRGPGTMTRTR